MSIPFTCPEPWERQFFIGFDGPAEVVPVDDVTAWEKHPKFRWVYDRLKIAEMQNLPAGMAEGATRPAAAASQLDLFSSIEAIGEAE